MTNSIISRIRYLCIAALVAWAGSADAQITGPLTGYIVHTPTNSIRAIAGVPGGAMVGDPVVRDIQFGSVSLDGRWALIQRAEAAAMVKLGAAEAPELPVAGLAPGIDAAAWSGSGQVVAAYSSASGTLQPVRLSAGQWVAGPPVDLSGLPGRLTSLSVNDAGDRIAVGLTDAESGGLYLVSGGVAALLMAAPLPVIAAFAPRTQTLLAAGSVRGTVEVFEGDTHIGSLAPASEAAAGAEVAGVAPSADGRRLLVAFNDLPGLFAFDLPSGQAVSEHPLDAAPTAFNPIAGGLWLVLNSPRTPSEPVILVHERELSATYFVPIGEL